jgi:phosphate transport system substrate-binding protein
MKTKLILLGATVMAVTILGSCKRKHPQQQAAAPTDTQISGTVAIAADESFQPILDQELFVFKGLYTEAKPRVKYGTENAVLNSLLSDSVRVAIMARELNADEVKVLANRTLRPEAYCFAIDAVVLIVNNASNDTTMTVREIKDMLNGRAKQDANIVFDNPNSSLVRYLKDFSGNKDLKQKNIFALKTNKDVITYVSQHPNAIGIVGFGWLVEPDADYEQAANNVKVVAVKDESNKKAPNEFFKPSQSTLALKEYPLSRRLYMINCTGNPTGLGTGFENFLTSQRGQRIILKSGLLPDSLPQREINVIHKLSIK